MGRFISEPVDDEMDNPFGSLNEKAEKALAYYKETEGVDYELIKILAAQPAPVGPFVVLHLNFVAVEKDNAVHGFLKLFFAEVFIVGDEIVNCCVILNARSSGMINGCFACDDYVIHPKGVEFFRLPHVTMPGCDPGAASDYLEDCVNCGIPRKSKHFPRCLNCGVITGLYF